MKSLLDTIQYCQENNIQMYEGGQFELDIGREHIHAVASIFYPDSPNDVAPRIYNQEKIPENPPKSPLKPKKTRRPRMELQIEAVYVSRIKEESLQAIRGIYLSPSIP